MKVKEIRFSPRTEEHDLRNKRNQVAKFLKKGHKVRIVILFRRWEKRTMLEIAKEKLETFTNLGRVGNPIRMDGNRLSVTLM
ncbi:MAG: hypothetical protein AB7L09_01085 [Nitrospira sp.]